MSADRAASTRIRLPRLVWATAWVSFFADLSTELIYGILPAYYLGTLAIGLIWLGVIEGFAETVVSITKLFSGYLSDRFGNRKGWMLAGYALAALAKPALALVSSGQSVAIVRAVDRLGKGIRGAPRDALVAAAVDPTIRGRAFGVQRALDHAGALAGGLLAAALLALAWVEPKGLFLLSLLPGMIAVFVIAGFVHEPPPADRPPSPRAPFSPWRSWRGAPPALRRYLIPISIFSLANSSDMLLLALCYQRFTDAGQSQQVALAQLPLLWAALHVVKSLGSAWGGALSDRIGRARLLAMSWLIYSAIYAIAIWFALGGPLGLAWVIFGVYGLFAAFAEGPERALIADLQPDASLRGTAYGLINFCTGILALPATLGASLLWYRFGPAPAFAADAALAAAAIPALAWALRARAGATPKSA